MGPDEATRCADLIDEVLSQVRPVSLREYELAPQVSGRVRAQVVALCDEFPLPDYPRIAAGS